MKKPLYIVKVGGKILETDTFLSQTLDQFAELDGKKILVHGGGRAATDLASKLGVEAPMIGGRRITSDEMLEVAIMVYGGLMNKQLVADLQGQGVQALGMTGADLNMILAHKRLVKDLDYGWAGDIDWVNRDNIQRLLQGGVVPVFAPLTHDGKGQLLNTNADTIASSIAVAMSERFEVKLAFVFEKKGVLEDPDKEESLIPHIQPSSFASFVEEGKISGGMIPKLTNAFDALRAGVHRVFIGKYDSVKELEKEEYLGSTISLEK